MLTALDVVLQELAVVLRELFALTQASTRQHAAFDGLSERDLFVRAQ